MLIALRDLLECLGRYSLVQWAGDSLICDSLIYSVHRLVQAVVREQMAEEKAAEWLAQAIAAVADAYPGDDFEHWPLCRQLLPHWLRIVEQAKAIEHRSTTLGNMCDQAGRFLGEQGRYKEAEPLYQQALEIRRTELGDRHPSTATTLLNLAVLYHQTQRSAQALFFIKQALAIYIPILGHDHPNTQLANCWLQTIELALSENNSPVPEISVEHNDSTPQSVNSWRPQAIELAALTEEESTVAEELKKIFVEKDRPLQRMLGKAKRGLYTLNEACKQIG